MFDQRIADSKHLIAEAVSRLRHALKEAGIEDLELDIEIGRLEEQGKVTVEKIRRKGETWET